MAKKKDKKKGGAKQTAAKASASGVKYRTTKRGKGKSPKAKKSAPSR